MKLLLELEIRNNWKLEILMVALELPGIILCADIWKSYLGQE